jgi:hypothetical protein
MQQDLKKSLFEDPQAEVLVEISNQPEDPEWERFIADSVSGTIFHKKRFLSYHSGGRFEFLHLKFRDAQTKELIAVIPGGVKNNSYCSPCGASYGGFAFKKTDLAVLYFEEEIRN